MNLLFFFSELYKKKRVFLAREAESARGLGNKVTTPTRRHTVLVGEFV